MYVHLQCATTHIITFLFSGNSLERIQQYLEIEHEPEPTASGIPPAYWPASGDLQVKGLSAKYSETGNDVLRGISFEVKSGERIGIVGRTGSGKVTSPFTCAYEAVSTHQMWKCHRVPSLSHYFGASIRKALFCMMASTSPLLT